MIQKTNRKSIQESDKEWIIQKVRTTAEKLDITLKDHEMSESYIVWKLKLSPQEGTDFLLAFYEDGIRQLSDFDGKIKSKTKKRFRLFIKRSLTKWLLNRNTPNQQFYLYNFHWFHILKGEKLDL